MWDTLRKSFMLLQQNVDVMRSSHTWLVLVLLYDYSYTCYFQNGDKTGLANSCISKINSLIFVVRYSLKAETVRHSAIDCK